MKPHSKNVPYFEFRRGYATSIRDRHATPARPDQIHYLKNAGLMLEPWMYVWQLMHGVISDDPALIP